MLVACDLGHRGQDLEDGFLRIIIYLKHHPDLLATTQHTIVGSIDDMGIADLDGGQRQCSHADAVGLGVEILIKAIQTIIAAVAAVEATLVITLATLLAVLAVL